MTDRMSVLYDLSHATLYGECLFVAICHATEFPPDHWENQNRRKSQLRRLQNWFLGCFFGFCDPKMPLFDRKSTGSLPYLELVLQFMSRLSISHQPKLLVENRPNATENRPTSTQNRPDATFLCHFATLLRRFVQVANCDLRRIVLDFLTSLIRVGWRDNVLRFVSIPRWRVGLTRSDRRFCYGDSSRFLPECPPVGCAFSLSRAPGVRSRFHRPEWQRSEGFPSSHFPHSCISCDSW